ncbi:hypothetical protein K438DRAFT_2141622 [Mycena galopus ATCC 62051]|nr:hypothetical protein K438DRAFT_2141622 [Mycena galopus ATCC 62051]
MLVAHLSLSRTHARGAHIHTPRTRKPVAHHACRTHAYRQDLRFQPNAALGPCASSLLHAYPSRTHPRRIHTRGTHGTHARLIMDPNPGHAHARRARKTPARVLVARPRPTHEHSSCMRTHAPRPPLVAPAKPPHTRSSLAHAPRASMLLARTPRRARMQARPSPARSSGTQARRPHACRARTPATHARPPPRTGELDALPAHTSAASPTPRSLASPHPLQVESEGELAAASSTSGLGFPAPALSSLRPCTWDVLLRYSSSHS